MSARPILLATVLLAACAARSHGPVSHGQVAFDTGAAIPQEFLPALEALEQAVRDGDEVVARSILEHLYARHPEGRALELARSFERILDGRALVRDLDLRLEGKESAEAAGQYTVTLVASHHREEELRLRAGAARLRETLYGVQPDGAEQRESTSRALDELGDLRLPAGEETRVALAELYLPSPPGTLAQRARLELELFVGELEVDERVLPAQQVPVAPAECVRLASFLPATAVEPSELLRYVLDERVRRPALMERAVRIAPARRAEALDLVAGRLDELSVVTLGELVPALRWLSGTDGPGGDPEEWHDWLAARAKRRAAAAESGGRSGPLSIPRPPEDASR